MNDLTLDDIRRLLEWYSLGESLHATMTPEDEALYERISEVAEERMELEDIDLNDCAGGACKL